MIVSQKHRSIIYDLEVKSMDITDLGVTHLI